MIEDFGGSIEASFQGVLSDELDNKYWWHRVCSIKGKSAAAYGDRTR